MQNTSSVDRQELAPYLDYPGNLSRAWPAQRTTFRRLRVGVMPTVVGLWQWGWTNSGSMSPGFCGCGLHNIIELSAPRAGAYGAVSPRYRTIACYSRAWKAAASSSHPEGSESPRVAKTTLASPPTINPAVANASSLDGSS